MEEIKKIFAREILDSRGNPTVEVELGTNQGFFRSAVPSGASEGKYEALELRDGGKRYHGKGVLKAVKNINEIIGPKLIGQDPTQQKEIDNLMINLDGTKNKSKLGSNAILAVSMVVCRAGAILKNLPLHKYIGQLAESRTPPSRVSLPVACFNIINGGVHAGNDLDFQEFMICPHLESFSKNLEAAAEIYYDLKEILKSKFGKIAINIGDEGGFVPPLILAEQALDLILEAVEKAGYKNSTKLIIDAAASEFFIDGKYRMKRIVFTKDGLLNYYLNLLKKYSSIFALEDPFAQDDWEEWTKLNSEFRLQPAQRPPVLRAGPIQNSEFVIFGDDLLATNIKRIRKAKDKEACNGLVLKIDQVGAVTEAIEAAKLASQFGWKIMVSHRSGETNDDFISDLAVGISADFIKSGAPARGERVAKYNRLLKIEEEFRSGR